MIRVRIAFPFLKRPDGRNPTLHDRPSAALQAPIQPTPNDWPEQHIAERSWADSKKQATGRASLRPSDGRALSSVLSSFRLIMATLYG